MTLHATRHLDSPDATTAFAKGLASVLRGVDVVALAGDLGAGKTTLVRELTHALGGGHAHSPTFVLVNEYPLTLHGRGEDAQRSGASRLIHIDAYRLSSTEDLDTLGWDTFMDTRLADAHGRASGARTDAIVLIEWAERIADALPTDLARISLSATGEESREVTLDFPDSWRDRPGVPELLERDPIRCRVTGAWVSPTNPAYPFADARARMADLGKWFGEGFKVSRGIEERDFDEDGPSGLRS